LDEEQEVEAGDARNRREVLGGIEGKRLDERDADGSTDREDQQRVSVRRRGRGGLCGNDATRAWPILDDHALTEPLTELVGQNAHGDVREPAGPEADDDTNGFDWKC